MSGKRILAVAVVAASVLGVSGAVAAFRTVSPYGHVAVVYLAQQYCACRHVAGRSAQSCRAEFQPDIAAFTVEETPAGSDRPAEVTAQVAYMKGVSVFEPPYGCRVAR